MINLAPGTKVYRERYGEATMFCWPGLWYPRAMSAAIDDMVAETAGSR